MNINTSIKSLSDSLLLVQTDFLVERERADTILILRHLREIEIRRLFIDLEYPSMHKYCIKHLKYSEYETQMRLSSARLLQDLPEIETKIENGDLNLTNLSQVQTFIRAEKFHVTLDSKGQVIKTFQVQLNEAEQKILQEFRDLYAHELDDQSDFNTLMFLLKKATQFKKKKLGLIDSVKTGLNQKDTKIAKSNSDQMKSHQDIQNVNLNHNSENHFLEDNKNELPTDEQNSNAPLPCAPKVINFPPQRKALTTSLKKQVWVKAQGQCEHHDLKKSHRCESKFALEIDHIESLALGGTNETANLRLLCRAHNSRRAIQTFGIDTRK